MPPNPTTPPPKPRIGTYWTVPINYDNPAPAGDTLDWDALNRCTMETLNSWRQPWHSYGWGPTPQPFTKCTMLNYLDYPVVHPPTEEEIRRYGQV